MMYVAYYLLHIVYSVQTVSLTIGCLLFTLDEHKVQTVFLSRFPLSRRSPHFVFLVCTKNHLFRRTRI